MYLDWAFTQYIQKVRHGEMKVGTVKIVSTFKKSVFCPMGPNFWACLKVLKVGILQYWYKRKEYKRNQMVLLS